MFHDFGRDLRFAIRSLTSAPGFCLGVIGSLILGIVANTTAFSFLNAAVFRPFPGVRDQHELVQIGLGRVGPRGVSDTSSSYEEYQTLRAALPALNDLAAHHRLQLVVTHNRESSTANGALVSTNWLDVLGVRPAAGRFFLPDDSDASAPVAVIGHDLRLQLFPDGAAAIGQTILVNGVSTQIIGVAPPRFYGIHKGSYRMDVWLPLAMSHIALRDSAHRPVSIASAGYLSLTYVGRRRPGTTLPQVEAQAAAASQQVNALRPPDRQGTTVRAGRVWLNDPARMVPAILAFMAVPFVVLVIACVNAANLLLARSSRQSREWRTRLALGASTWRLVRQVLAESVLLASVSGVAGLFMTSWVLALIGHTIPVPAPIDARVQAFTIGAAILTALAFGLGPALRVASQAASDPRGLSPVAAGASRSRIRFTLIAAQAALSLALLATGAQFVNTVKSNFGREDPVGADRVLITAFDLAPLNLPREAVDDFYARLLTRVAALPGVVAAAGANGGPLTGAFSSDASIRVWLPEDAPGEGRDSLAAFVSGDYFKAASTPLIQGRLFDGPDRSASPGNVVVSQSFARRFFGSNPLNRSIRVAFGRGEYASAIELTVVGVVGPALGERADGAALLYYPTLLRHTPARSMVVQFDESGRFTGGALRNAVREVDYRVPIGRSATLRERRSGEDDERRLVANGVAALGIVALTLAAGGLYGVISYLVALRRREIGVRLALGATRASVVGLIVRQGLVPTAIGSMIGAGGAVAIGLVVRSRLYGASPADPVAFAAAGSLLIATMLIASLVPARSAAAVNPVVILRED